MARPVDVGILAIDIYFPRTTVRQSDLESFDKIPKGKYTVGLGQTNMAFVGDREDIVSICLTAVANFFEKFRISPNDIGRVEVGTETLVDKAKSVKTYLMTLFGENTNVEGADNINACYGGTNALLNAFNWVESQTWDGRYALVVAADVAVYEAGPARPTGGCGAVVMLVGPNAPLVVERGLTGTHAEHVYDFYKPLHDKEYALVNGKLSQECYLRSLDKCYGYYKEKWNKNATFNPTKKNFSLDDTDYMVFHAPYNKLVQQSLARLVFNDFVSNPNDPRFQSVVSHKGKKLEDSYTDKDIASDFWKAGKPIYDAKVTPSITLPTEIGNMYCGSLYAGLLSLLVTKQDQLVGKRLLLFSYGSGCLSTLFSIVVTRSVLPAIRAASVQERLQKRLFVDPAEFTKILANNEVRFLSKNYTPTQPFDQLLPGTFYLTKIDETYRRFYERLPPAIANAKL